MTDQEIGQLFRNGDIKQIMKNVQTHNIFMKLYYWYEQLNKQMENRNGDSKNTSVQKTVILG